MLTGLWNRLRRWFVNPAPLPHQIGTPAARGMRPIVIPIVFTLHPDGTVYQRRRRGGDERVVDEHLIGLAHREYRDVVAQEYRKRGLPVPAWIVQHNGS